MNVEVLRAQLSALGLDAKGHKKTLRKRLRRHLAAKIVVEPAKMEDNSIISEARQQSESPFSSDSSFKEENNDLKHGQSDTSLCQLDYTKFIQKLISKEQPFQYYLCFDVEATCERGGGFDYMHEIIEFPILLLESKTFEIVDVFHSYVKPSIDPVLSDFCKELTGIPQTTIDVSPSFLEMLNSFQKFLHQHQLFYKNTCAFITDGPWDIRDFIRKQCEISQIDRPLYFSLPWVDIRALFSEFYNCRKDNIVGMLSKYGLEFEGHEHSGIDDAKNLAIIAKRMWEDGAIFKVNRDLKNEISRKRGVRYKRT